ncbi:MAG: hypothetical protein Q4E62_00850 [Sutterellaceae bacterium]|nr:hypothetical protein [Sutterellaceae bacterium]
MAQQFIQQLTVFLKGGQNIVVPFNAEKPEVLNPQIDAFVKALGTADQKDKNFLFQGARVVLVRLADVSAIDVVSLVRKEEEKKEEKAEGAA